MITREEWDARARVPVESSGQQHARAADLEECVLRCPDSGAAGELKRDGLPQFDSVRVGLLRELGDAQTALLVDYGDLGPRAAQR